MNYIDYLNKFQAASEENVLMPHDWALYFRLLQIANKRFWPESFKVPAALILGTIGRMSRKGLCASRERLRDAGLIDYTEGSHGVEMAEYRLLGDDEQPRQQPKEESSQTPQATQSTQNTPSTQSTQSTQSSQSSQSTPSEPPFDEFAHDTMMNKLRADRQWIDRVAIMEGMQQDKVRQKIEEFGEHCRVMRLQHDALIQAERHFANWLRKERKANQNIQNNYGNNTYKPTYVISPRIPRPVQAGEDPRRGVAADAKKEKNWDAPF